MQYKLSMILALTLTLCSTVTYASDPQMPNRKDQFKTKEWELNKNNRVRIQGERRHEIRNQVRNYNIEVHNFVRQDQFIQEVGEEAHQIWSGNGNQNVMHNINNYVNNIIANIGNPGHLMDGQAGHLQIPNWLRNNMDLRDGIEHALRHIYDGEGMGDD